MHNDVLRAFAAWGVGAMLVGVALTLLGLTWWWTLARERFGAVILVARAGLGLAGCALLWMGLAVMGIGTESFLGDPLGRWSGASMVPVLWIALELLARDQALCAGLASRDLGTRVVWVWARSTWIVAKLAFVLSCYVVLWALLGV